MSREIKFRAWDLNEHKMRYNGEYCEDVYLWSIDCASELMQYTGLKDKNGKEIYEGDIIRITGIPYESQTVIEWEEDEGGFNTAFLIAEMCHKPHENYEVIGNIYEDEHLLESYPSDSVNKEFLE